MIDLPLAARLAKALGDLRPLYEQSEYPRLVHRDFHFENVLCHNGAITGVIDFEWSLWGDPLCDFRTEDEMERVCPGSSAAVYAAYGALRPLPDDFRRRLTGYRMLMALEYLEDAATLGRRGTQSHHAGGLPVAIVKSSLPPLKN